jgi:hypothetical protein
VNSYGFFYAAVGVSAECAGFERGVTVQILSFVTAVFAALTSLGLTSNVQTYCLIFCAKNARQPVTHLIRLF